jgi:hypothetical protein
VKDGDNHLERATYMRARQIELEHLRATGLGLFGEHGPVLLDQRAHDRRDDDTLGKIAAQLLDRLAPIGRRLLADQLDVGERALVRAKVAVRRRAAHDAWRHICDEILVERERLGDSEAPALLEAAADHRAGRARRRRRQTKRIREAHAANVNREINAVDISVEHRQLGDGGHRQAKLALQVRVHAPRGRLAVIDRLDGGAVADQIATGEQPRRRLGDVAVEVDVGVAVALERERRGGGAHRIVDLRAKRRDDKVGAQTHKLVLVDHELAIVVELGLVHFERLDATSVGVAHHRLGRAPRQPLAALLLRRLALLGHSAHVADAATERHIDALGAAAERRRRAVHRRVAGAKHHHAAIELGQLRLARAHAGLAGGRDGRQKVLGRVEAVGLGQVLEHVVDLGRRHADAAEDGGGAVLLERLDGEVAAERLVELDLDAEVAHQIDLELHDVERQAELRNLERREAADKLVLLIDGDVGVAETREKRGARDRRRAAADQRDLGGERRRQRGAVERRIVNLLDAHLHENFGGKVLQAANVDRTLLGGVERAAANTEVAGRTDHAAREAERVV